jgi:hypothetical protein
MRAPALFAILSLGAVLTPPPQAEAQGGAPPGSYRQVCRDIRMEGIFLHAWCRGSRGSGQSSINVQSCGTDIGVDPDGGLICGAPQTRPTPLPPPNRPPPYPGPGDDYDRPGGGRNAVVLFDRRDFRGREMRVWGAESNLARSGFNDRARSIDLPRRGPPWLVCADANFRGRCVTIDRSVEDTRRLGLGDAISSLRPLR